MEPAGNVLYGHLRRSGRYASLVTAAERGDDGPLRRVARLFEIITSRDPRCSPTTGCWRCCPTCGRSSMPARRSGTDDSVPGVDAVSVLTVHKAKGLEFRVVFVLGLVEGRFPLRGRPERLSLPAALRVTRCTERGESLGGGATPVLRGHDPCPR